MRLQKRIILISTGILLFIMIAYAMLLFVCEDDYIIVEYLKSVTVGIIGSMFVSLVISILTYSSEKHKELENYYTAYIALFNHCGKYSQEEPIGVKLKWFETYNVLFHKLDDAWASIDYIYDKNKHRKYLTAVRNYYFDFISLTQDHFDFLEYNEDCTKHHIDYIERVIYEIEVPEMGLFKHTVRHNRLTYDMNRVFDEIQSIYHGKHDSNVMFLKTLVTQDVFLLLSDEEETAVRLLQNQINQKCSLNVSVDITDEICKSLNEKGYIGSYSSERKGRIIFCRSILNSYFELKSRFSNR